MNIRSESTFLKALFIGIFLFSTSTILLRQAFYPTVRFPQFPAKDVVDAGAIAHVRLRSSSSGDVVDLMSVIRPFDKQYYLFAMRALADSSKAPGMLAFLNDLYRKQGAADSLRVEVIHFPVE